MIEVGEYVRTTSGEIGKVRVIIQQMIFINDNQYFHDLNKIKSHSKDIINLIEVGDVIVLKDERKYEVISIMNGFNEGTMEVKLSNNAIIYRNHLEDIELIVTKEQFSSVEYRLDK